MYELKWAIHKPIIRETFRSNSKCFRKTRTTIRHKKADVNFTVRSNNMNAKSLLDYICYHYSYLSVGIVEYDLSYGHGLCFCVGG